MAFERVNKLPMTTLILQHLKKNGDISSMEANGIYKCRSLSRRITDLRELGHHITAEWKKDQAGQRYRRYSMFPPHHTVINL